MCGISGIIVPANGSVLEAALQNMHRALQHRGPDDEGIKVLGGGPGGARAGFAHRRLSILDLSEAGHQPMGIASAETLTSTGGTPVPRYWIVFNGEIYNFRQLRSELEAEGVQFRSSSDTEVILRLYERDGERCVDRLRGMFAFAIWDEVAGTCFLVRDPLGIKPLYYREDQGTLVFASELRAIVASGLVPRKLNPRGLDGYFQTGSVPSPDTIVEGVHSLPAGHWIIWQAGKLRKQRYWKLEFGQEELPYPEAVERTRAALLDSVRHHFVSDVPVGIFLSGGIDSTALLALAGIAGFSDIRTFSVGVDDPGLDEAGVAAQTAATFGSLHSQMRLDGGSGRALFSEYLRSIDQPSIDGFNTFCVSRFARDNGMKVVLSGLGGDEIFGGYPSFWKVPAMMKVARGLGPLRGLLGLLVERYGPNPPIRRFGTFLQQAPALGAAYRAFRGTFAAERAGRLVSHFIPGWDGRDRSVAPEPENGLCDLDGVSELEIQGYMRNQLLRDSDTMSMASGLELRVPFVDRGLLEAVGRMKGTLRIRQGKQLLVDAVPEIPRWIIERPKQGFMFPFEKWLAGDWQDVFEGQLRASTVPLQTWYQKWTVFVLLQWSASVGISA